MTLRLQSVQVMYVYNYETDEGTFVTGKCFKLHKCHRSVNNTCENMTVPWKLTKPLTFYWLICFFSILSITTENVQTNRAQHTRESIPDIDLN